MQKIEKFPAAFEIRNDLLTQGYGADRAKSSNLRSILLHRFTKRCGQESTEAEFSAHTSTNNNLTSVHSRNRATGEEL
jgi:hypothetical protein